MLCSYCKTESLNSKKCNFCKADFNVTRPVLIGYLSAFETELTQPELTQKHTYDLILILKQIREERTNWYRVMQRVRKTPSEALVSDSDREFAIHEYKTLTARQSVIEQLLVDRMGYYPKRIDSKLLNALQNKIEKYKPKG